MGGELHEVHSSVSYRQYGTMLMQGDSPGIFGFLPGALLPAFERKPAHWSMIIDNTFQAKHNDNANGLMNNKQY